MPRLIAVAVVALASAGGFCRFAGVDLRETRASVVEHTATARAAAKERATAALTAAAERAAVVRAAAEATAAAAAEKATAASADLQESAASALSAASRHVAVVGAAAEGYKNELFEKTASLQIEESTAAVLAAAKQHAAAARAVAEVRITRAIGVANSTLAIASAKFGLHFMQAAEMLEAKLPLPVKQSLEMWAAAYWPSAAPALPLPIAASLLLTTLAVSVASLALLLALRHCLKRCCRRRTVAPAPAVQAEAFVHAQGEPRSWSVAAGKAGIQDHVPIKMASTPLRRRVSSPGPVQPPSLGSDGGSRLLEALNTRSVEELLATRNIGTQTVNKITAFREVHGHIESVDDLQSKVGIHRVVVQRLVKDFA